MSYTKARDGLAALARSGLGLAEITVLLHIAAREEQPKVVDVSEEMKSPLSTTSRHLWHLYQLGLLVYHEEEFDRRVKRVSLTRKALNLLEPFVGAA